MNKQLLLKYGAIDVASTAPENPALQTHPAATLMPLLSTGHKTAVRCVTIFVIMFLVSNVPTKTTNNLLNSEGK